ncbi:MAG: hypothetical protein AB1Z23_04645 [Eubacteriales bacterium]
MDTSIQDNLLPGEEILWEGQPQVANRLNIGNITKSIFGVFWLGFSLFWTLTAFLATRNINASSATGSILKYFFPLFGLPFVAIGIFMVFISPIKQRKKNLMTFYYITDKRIIINVNTLKSPTFNSLFIKDLNDVRITKNRDNTGTIIFGSSFANSGYTARVTLVNSPNYYTSTTPDNCFYRIFDAEDVYKLILIKQEIANLEENSI